MPNDKPNTSQKAQREAEREARREAEREEQYKAQNRADWIFFLRCWLPVLGLLGLALTSIIYFIISI